jgi:hypothetical protein
MKLMAIVVLGLMVAGAASAATVEVVVTGSVEWNSINFGQFGSVGSGDPVTIEFTLDSENYADSTTYPTRGYVVDTSTFMLTIGSVVVGAQDPYPGDPYFVLRDNDPAVDGFFLSTNSVDWPMGFFTDEPVMLDPFFACMYEVGYGEDALSSLDILDAFGTYDYTGLTNF